MSSQDAVEDFLEVDQPVPGQNFVCLSFISPEKVLKRKEAFFGQEFVKFYLKSLRDKENPEFLDPEKLTPEYVDTLNYNEIYEDFMYSQEEELNKKFQEMNDFQTSIRGLKVRGIYESKREAEVRAKVLQRRDPNFHVYVAQVGYWLPWDPNPDNIGEQEYANEQLNTLMKEYMKNRSQRDELYAQEVEDKKKAAREENMKRKAYQQRSQEEEEEAACKIKELRDIADEKDRRFQEIKSEENPMSGLNDTEFADPWMARKQQTGQNFQTGSSSRAPTDEEKNEMLNQVEKDIF